MNGLAAAVPLRTPTPIARDLAAIEPILNDRAVRHHLVPLQEHLQREGVVEVCVNRPGEVWVKADGAWSRFADERLTFEHLEGLAMAVATLTGQTTSERKPLLSAALASGERLLFAQPSATSPDVVGLAIRKPIGTTRTLEEMEASGLFDELRKGANPKAQLLEQLRDLQRAHRYQDFLRAAVRGRLNIVVAGATGSGKTTLMKALADEIPPHERLITIEDSAELTLPNRANKLHLFYSKGGQGASDVSADQLLEACLRFAPDRILQAELRGEEAYSYLDLAASGHPGSITSVHAGSCAEAFDRIALMVRKSRAGSGLTMPEIERLARGVIDVVVHMANEDRRYFITELHFAHGAAIE